MYTTCMLEIVHTLQDIQSFVIMKDFRMDHWSEIAIHRRATMTRFKVITKFLFYLFTVLKFYLTCFNGVE